MLFSFHAICVIAASSTHSTLREFPAGSVKEKGETNPTSPFFQFCFDINHYFIQLRRFTFSMQQCNPFSQAESGAANFTHPHQQQYPAATASRDIYCTFFPFLNIFCNCSLFYKEVNSLHINSETQLPNRIWSHNLQPLQANNIIQQECICKVR